MKDTLINEGTETETSNYFVRMICSVYSDDRSVVK